MSYMDIKLKKFYEISISGKTILLSAEQYEHDYVNIELRDGTKINNVALIRIDGIGVGEIIEYCDYENGECDREGIVISECINAYRISNIEKIID